MTLLGQTKLENSERRGSKEHDELLEYQCCKLRGKLGMKKFSGSKILIKKFDKEYAVGENKGAILQTWKYKRIKTFQ